MQTGPNASTVIDGWLETGSGDKPVLITADDATWTANQLYAAVCNVATNLTEIGVGRGDRVVMVLDDTPAFPATFLGAMRIGAIPVPVNFLARAEDLGYVLEDSYAVAVVMDHAFVDTFRSQVDARPHVQLVIANGDAPDGAMSHDRWMSAGSNPIEAVATHADDVAFWLYSSGSTGRPKGVVHRHEDLGATVRHYAIPTLGIGEGDVGFSSTKMFHAYGLGNNLSFPLWAGATSIYLTGRPDPAAIIERVRTHAPTLLFCVPALYNAMLAHPGFDEVDWSSVRLGVSAAEPLPPEIWRQFNDRTGIEILDGIGSTEMLHIYCSNRPGAVKPGSSGTAVDGYEIEIRDPDGELCEPGGSGEMWVAGPTALSSYWHQIGRTRDKIRGRWFLSGDRYHQGDDGYYVYEGRVDDMMKIGGLWVSPIEIENRLMEHVAVQEAAVVAVEVDLRSRIKAAVILVESARPTADLVAELQEWCKATLQRYQFPHMVEFVDDFPRTVTGKVQRFKLRSDEMD